MSDINWHKSADLNAQRAKIEKWRSEVEEQISDLESEKEELEAERDELEADTPDESAFREKIIDDLISGRDPEGLKEVSAAFPEVVGQHDWVSIDKKEVGSTDQSCFRCARASRRKPPSKQQCCR